jgi:mono/diheme cytochrome c family protein
MSVVAFAVLATIAAAPAPAPASAVEMGFPGNGEALALEICSDCHVVSDRQVRVETVSLPSFRAVVNYPEYTEIWFRTFMRTTHPTMPNFILTDQQLDDLTAYNNALKK